MYSSATKLTELLGVKLKLRVLFVKYCEILKV